MTKEDLTILVVDDVNAIRIQIRDLLRKFGFRNVQAVGNGEEAKAVLQTQVVHLILSDWQMTPTDGMTLLKYMKETPRLSDIPFIMVTAEATKDKVIEAIKCGVDDYLVKPLTIQQIQNKVYGVLLKRQVLS